MPEPQSPKFGPAERGRSDRETRVRLKGLFLLKIMVQISSKSDDRFCHSGFPNMAVSAFFARLGDERVRLNSKYFFFSHQGRSLPSCSPLFFENIPKNRVAINRQTLGLIASVCVTSHSETRIRQKANFVFYKCAEFHLNTSSGFRTAVSRSGESRVLNGRYFAVKCGSDSE